MGDANDVQGCIRENLEDAGFSEEHVVLCLELLKEGREKELLARLSEQRSLLLSRLNQCKSEIDALDYLTYSLRRKKNV